ncbi:MAG TPA: PGPGW domain-containing protein [Actinomycetota bacterium]|nr:PGPGW domain-containing protein [Actinomycetota bacterium]
MASWGKRIVEQRERQILAPAAKHLRAGERIVRWARGRHPRGGREGFVYVTNERYIVAWTRGGKNFEQTVAWDDVQAWGVDATADGGPVLCVEDAARDIVLVQIAVPTTRAADNAARLLGEVARRAPENAASSGADGALGRFEKRHDVAVVKERRSLLRRVRRIVVTVLGVLLVVLALVTSWIPGPNGIPMALAGLALLATEYDWAKDLLDWAKERFNDARHRIKERRRARADVASESPPD